jgi:hypothetical protein
MFNRIRKITRKLNETLRFLRWNFVYLLIEKVISYFLGKRSFRRYLFANDRFSNIANQVMGITSDGRIHIEHLEVDIVKGCNLQCKYCSHISPLRKGYIPFEQLSEWFETWSKKVVPDHFTILGGEPLLHPEVDKVILATGKYWKESQIEFVTNGLLLSKQSQCVFDALRAVNAEVHVSKHFDNPEFNLKFQKSIDCLAKTGVPFRIRLAYQKWAETYRIEKSNGINGGDQPLPFNSNFNKAWKNCRSPKRCACLSDNLLYRCAAIAAFQDAYKEKIIGHEWSVVNGYQPLSPDCSVYDIFVHLNSGAFPECCVCPEQLNIVKPEQFQLKAS